MENANSKHVQNLSMYTKEQLRLFINQFDVIFCDCDGVLYLNGSVIDNSNTVINNFLENGKQIFLLTNNTTLLREEVLSRYQKLGFNIKIDNILTSPYLTAKYLHTLNFNKKVYVIGCENVGKELEKFGIQHVGIGEDPIIGDLSEYVTKHYQLEPDVGAVAVSMDSKFSMPKLLKAMNYLLKPDVMFLATNEDDRSEFPGFVFPDAGPFLAAIERGSYRKATVIGKPSPILSNFIDLPENKQKVLMIGDRLNIDIAFGKNAGFKTLLVETGDHKMENINEYIEKIKKGSGNENLIPDFVISSIGKFCDIFY